jgi:acetyltransferase-like isoleucine patch superfamily enzyme
MSCLNVEFGQNVVVHPSTSFNDVAFGDNIRIAKDCSFHGSPEHMVKIGSGTIIGMCVLIDGSEADVIIGDHASIAQHNIIVSNWNVAPGSKLGKLFPVKAAPIIIGENTWIGSSCVIAPGVTIGKCCIIASNSYVDADVPDYSIYGGSPAKFLKAIDPKELGL